MMSKLNNPPIMVIAAMHFHRPFGFLFFYFSRRWRRFPNILFLSTVVSPESVCGCRK